MFPELTEAEVDYVSEKVLEWDHSASIARAGAA
jgi:hypothetical protein